MKNSAAILYTLAGAVLACLVMANVQLYFTEVDPSVKEKVEDTRGMYPQSGKDIDDALADGKLTQFESSRILDKLETYRSAWVYDAYNDFTYR